MPRRSDAKAGGEGLIEIRPKIPHLPPLPLTKGEATQEIDGPMTTELKVF